ncbi:MAG: hypothetical protein A2X83_02380 [Desulfuromonadales bacterium GWD2_54_10]|nr:MAG: hypothetical protein A2X83_02380 [Desulfuromonadales bacterium GWD2_54_10]
MKLTRLIIPMVLISCGLAGCANPVVIKINEDSNRISSLAQVAKGQLEDCRFKNDKSACDDVDASLNEIIITSNGLPEVVQHMKSPFQK